MLGTAGRYPAPHNWHYVPFVTEPQTAPEHKSWFPDDTIRILTVGKYEPRKNHGLFLQVIARLSERHPIRCTVVGECSTPEHERQFARLQQRAAELGLGRDVSFRVNLPFCEVQDQYRQHDVFVLASGKEAAAVSPLEAMAHSLPVVCSDSNGTECYIRPGENGFVFRTDDEADLEECLKRIVGDREALVRMGAAQLRNRGRRTFPREVRRRAPVNRRELSRIGLSYPLFVLRYRAVVRGMPNCSRRNPAPTRKSLTSTNV